MPFTDLTIRLLLLFLPGIVCFLIIEALTVHRERKTHEVLFFTFLYGMLSYLFYGLILLSAGVRFSKQRWLYSISPDPSFFRSLSDSKVQLDFWEIGSVTAGAVVLAFILSFCDKKKLLHKAANMLRVTNKFGEPDVWNYAFNLDDARWCVVRDLTNHLMYQGYIHAFSDVEEAAELILTQVVVYNEQTTQECYRADRMYLARKKDDLTIEFQNLPQGGGAQQDGREATEATRSGAREGRTNPSIGRGADAAPDGRNGEEGRTQSAEHEQRPAPSAGRQLPAHQQRHRRQRQ
jgi:hypothetical protein